MRERPILFSGEMVSAILDGRKTMTRRVMKPQPKGERSDEFHPLQAIYSGRREWQEGGVGYVGEHDWRCPYGKPGDRLWVKETWGCHFATDDQKPSDIDQECWSVRYFADDYVSPASRDGDVCPLDLIGKKRRSLFMPRWASRITLEVVSVKVERLQGITGDEAKSEGVPCSGWSEDDWIDSEGYATSHHARQEQAVEEFAELWDSINGKSHPWESNPFVWVVSFRRIADGAQEKEPKESR